jgi:hypothetical protein
MTKEKEFKFKDVELAINFKKLPMYDQEYVRTMFYETVLDRSVKHTGIGFDEFYPEASNFTVFDNEIDMINTMSEFANPFKYTVSHLLHGKKYYLAWTFDYNKANAVERIAGF